VSLSFCLWNLTHFLSKKVTFSEKYLLADFGQKTSFSKKWPFLDNTLAFFKNSDLGQMARFLIKNSILAEIDKKLTFWPKTR